MKRKIAAIFAADIAGYSRLVAEDEEETLRRLASARATPLPILGEGSIVSSVIRKTINVPPYNFSLLTPSPRIGRGER